MSAEAERLRVVLCWHMHQPDYRDPDGLGYHLPWVYLHGIKDYVDMAAHLEAVPGARAVVNFVPVLLEQIDDYARQIKAWQQNGRRISDPLLAALAGPGLPLEAEARRALIHACSRANRKHLINRFPEFSRLVEIGEWMCRHDEGARYLNDGFLADLLVWYHLAWLGESIRENDLRVASLQAKAGGFTHADRAELVALIGEQMASLVPRYRALAGRGQVELSVTPYAHPIVPLLLDIQSAREAIPEVDLPTLRCYPGGEARARWHIRAGLDSFERYFGFQPAGCWPAEGAVCEATLRLLEEEGFRWLASGQQVLCNSLMVSGRGAPLPKDWVYQRYRLEDSQLSCFFRDDGLSDLIGFTYGSWHADDAVANLIAHLENLDQSTRGMENRVVAIIMDGENAWEYYPHNAHFFLSALYQRLSEHPRLQLSRFADCLDDTAARPTSLSRLVAGSWVYGTLSTWIGDPDKNRAWDMLGEAKMAFDRMVATQQPPAEILAQWERQLAICEGSDWFWWFGAYNPSETVSDFEALFRSQLRHLYHLMGLEPPEYLSAVFARGSGAPALGGVMRKN